jgi:thiol-disulfide isomerase/thioredoxin
LVSAGDFDGQVWLANFWATWCAPCVEEMPMLSLLQQQYADEGVNIVGIALDDAQRASEFAAELGLGYRILVGKTDVVLTGRDFGNATGMLPFSVLVDAAGIIRWTHLGALSREELTEQIQVVLDR